MMNNKDLKNKTIANNVSNRACTVAIIGSFQKYYDEILEIIQMFKSAELSVLSPKESYISGRIKDFVIFDVDRKDYSPEEIEMITLNKIVDADYVYVYNPNGYLGRTVCYEIGFCLSRKKPIFFFEMPEDLPIPVLKEKQILKPEDFVSYVCSHNPTFITDYILCTEGKKAFCEMFDINGKIL